MRCISTSIRIAVQLCTVLFIASSSLPSASARSESCPHARFPIEFRELQPGPPMGADAYLPILAPCTRNWIILLHGGGWRYFDRRHSHARVLAEFFAAHGHPTLTLDYPKRGARHPAHVEHLAEAIAWLLKSPGFPNDARLVLVGISSGAQIATLLATAPEFAEASGWSVAEKIAGVVALTGVFEVPVRSRRGRVLAPRLFRNSFPEGASDRAAASPSLRLHPDIPPTLVISGRREPRALRRQARTFVQRAAALGAPVETTVDLNSGHLFASYRLARECDGPTAQALLQFLSKVGQDTGRNISVPDSE